MTTKPIGLALLGLVVAVSSLLAVGLTSAATVTLYGPEGVTPRGSGETALTLDSHATIHPEVMAKLSGSDEATFWAILHRQIDLSDAPDIGDWDERGRYVVDQLRFVADESQAGLIALLERRGVSYRPFWIVNAIRVTSDSAVLQELAARREVARIEPERVYHIPEPLPGTSPAGNLSPEWGISKINADDVWTTYGNTGQGIVVANIDTGVDYTHPALVNQYRGNLGGGNFDHNYNWYDPSQVCPPGNGTVPCDNNDHGTHTMGTIAGGDGPGPLVDDIGVAPGVKWIAAKGCETGSCSDFALLSSAQWILAPIDLLGNNPDPSMRPHVVNNSWGGGGGGDGWYMDSVQAWRASGIFPVFSAGNAGPFCGTAGSPGDYPESFGIGATNINDNIASFSSRGPSAFGGIVKPNVSAPGDGVRSSIPGGFAVFNGTSMAAPHVAGAVALVWAGEPLYLGNIPATFEVIESTALDIIDNQCGGDVGGDPNNVYGDGRINALAAVEAAFGGPPVIPDEVGVVPHFTGPTDAVVYIVSVTGGSGLTIEGADPFGLTDTAKLRSLQVNPVLAFGASDVVFQGSGDCGVPVETWVTDGANAIEFPDFQVGLVVVGTVDAGGGGGIS